MNEELNNINIEFSDGEQEEGSLIKAKSPRLDALEKLYVRSYLSSLSHAQAYRQVKPGLKSYSEDNPYSRRENVQFYINLSLQEKAEAEGLTTNKILQQLWKEAIREDRSSNHSARITALTTLGKHLGLFKEEKQKESHTFNIVSYGSPSSVKVEKVEEVEEEVQPTSLDFEITTYGDEE